MLQTSKALEIYVSRIKGSSIRGMKNVGLELKWIRRPDEQ